MPKRVTKPKATKKSSPKTRRKSKPPQPKAAEPVEEVTQSLIVEQAALAVETPPEVVEPIDVALEVEPEEPMQEVPPEEEHAAPPEVSKEQAPVPEPVAATASAVEQIPVSEPSVSPPLEPSAGEAEEEQPGEALLAEELPPRRDVPPNHMFIGKKPVMGYALSAVMQLTQYDEVVLRARGKAISRAVDVAEVIKHRLGNGQFVARYIKIDTDIVGEGAEKRNVSTIEIGVGKKA